MRTVSISELRADCFALLQQVEKTKKPIQITRFGQTLAEIHPCSLKSLNREQARLERDARDIEIINRNAERMNADAEDGLEDQAPWDSDDAKKVPLAKKKSRGR